MNLLATVHLPTDLCAMREYSSVCVCVCVCERERERVGRGEREREMKKGQVEVERRKAYLICCVAKAVSCKTLLKPFHTVCWTQWNKIIAFI